MFEVLKSVARHFLVYGMGSIANRVVGFILIPVYTHYLSTSEYGSLELLELVTYVVGMFLAMGIGSSVLRFYYDSDDPMERKQVVSTALLLTWGLSISGAILLLVFSPNISILVFKNSGNAGLFRLIFLSLMCILANEISLSFIRAQQKSLLYTIVSFSQLALSLGLNILFIVGFGWGIRGIILSSVINHALASIFLTFYTIRWCGFSFSFEKLKQLIWYGLPFIPGGMGMFVMNFADRFLLQRFTSLSEVGIYSLGYKFGMIMNPLVTTPYESIWRPKMFELATRDDAKKINSLMFTYFMFLEIFLGLGISVLIKDVLRIISSPEYHGAYNIVPFILLSYILNGAYIHMQVGILLEKKTQHIAYIVAASALSNLLLNLFLIPRLGISGAALSTLASFGIMFILNYVISNRIYYVRYQFARVFKLLALAVVLYLVSLGIDTNSLFFSLFVKTLLVLSFPFLLFLLRFYMPEEIQKTKEILSKAGKSFKLTFVRQ